MKKFILMNKKRYLSLFVLLLSVPFVLSGCGKNEVKIYLGVSDSVDGNRLLSIDEKQIISQNKEKIQDSKLVFNENAEGIFDDMYICFSGNNIECVEAGSDAKTVYYTEYDEVSRGLECIGFWYYPEKSDVDETFDPYRDMESRWDKGQFDDIKNVFFNGMSIYDITRGRRNHSIETTDEDSGLDYIANVDSNLCNPGEMMEVVYYLEESKKIDDVLVYTEMSSIDEDKKLPEKEEDLIIQGKTVKSNPNENFFLYKYERLFYNSQQKALKEKGRFDYSDLLSDKVEIAVHYTNGSTEKYRLNISFDEKGDIIAELSELK